MLNEFVKTDNTGFNYRWNGKVSAGEEIILRLPLVTANKRGVNDIGWQIDGDARLFATVSDFREDSTVIWQEIFDDEGINKTASAVKLIGGAGVSDVWLRVILN